MSHRRSVVRWRRRLSLLIGDRTRTFPRDLAPGGFAAEVLRPLKPGETVVGAIRLGDRSYDFTGQVVWAHAGEPRLNLRARIGERFTGIANAFFVQFLALSSPTTPA
jgi:hypothetical protein